MSSLLLDFDGVLFGNKKCLDLVVRKSTQFTRLHVPNYDPKTFDYRRHGHTVPMLKKEFNKDVDFQDYNDYVFDEEMFRQCTDLIGTEDYERSELWKIAMKGKRRDIFSNAPSVWVHTLLSLTGLESSFEDSHIICSDTIKDLKPSLTSYIKAKDILGEDDYVFLDDSPINVYAATKIGIRSMVYNDALLHHLVKRAGDHL